MINVDGYMRKERKMLPLVFERSGGCRPSRAKGSPIRTMEVLLAAPPRGPSLDIDQDPVIAHGVDVPYGLRHARPCSGAPRWQFFCYPGGCF